MKRVLRRYTTVIVWREDIIMDFFRAQRKNIGSKEMIYMAKNSVVTPMVDGSRIITIDGDYVETWKKISKQYSNSKFVISYVEEVANEMGVSNGELEELPEDIAEMIR